MNIKIEWFDSHVSKNIFLKCEIRMLSTLTCGLSAERSYTARKGHTISFSHLFVHEGILISLSNIYIK